MHVKQLTTSWAFQMIPRKACVCVCVYQDVKALQVSPLERVTGGDGQSAAACRCLRSQDSYLHIPQIYCNTLLSTNSTASVPRGVGGVSWTHTYTH